MSVKSLSEKGSESATGSLDDYNTPQDKALVRKIDLRYDRICIVVEPVSDRNI